MTQEEKILNKAIDYSEIEDNFLKYDDCGDVCDDKTFVEKAFIEGAKWAKENSIKKACEWLNNYVTLTDYTYGEWYNKEKLIKDFRRAMEE